MTPETVRLRERNEELEAEVRLLRQLLVTDTIDVPEEWCLTLAEKCFFRCLVAHRWVTPEMVYHALYWDRPDGGPDPKILDVYLCHLSRKTPPFGVRIKTLWGKGYQLEERQRWQGGIVSQ